MHIGFQFSKISNKIRREFDKRISYSGLTFGQTQIIRYIKENEDNIIIQKNIEEKFEIRGSSVTQALQTLEKHGFITRAPLESDKRLKPIKVTTKAEKLLKEVSLIIEDVENEVSSSLTKEEYDILNNILNKISLKIEKF